MVAHMYWVWVLGIDTGQVPACRRLGVRIPVDPNHLPKKMYTCRFLARHSVVLGLGKCQENVLESWCLWHRLPVGQHYKVAMYNECALSQVGIRPDIT